MKPTANHPKKQPWPTERVMTQIYQQKMWGDNGAVYYSGEGSHLPELVQPYLERMRSFLTSLDTPIYLLDLGCGDFNVGKELVRFTQKYIAVDIVEELIVYNQEKFKATNLEFHCMNIVTDEWPKADCVVLRQVLQHLSNAEIADVVEKLKQYTYLILTEHLPGDDFTPNVDILSGQGTRLKKQSGVVLTEAPFYLTFLEQKELLSVILKDGKGVIKTMVYRLR
jgi:SAM-dependent methyltransferase